MPGETLAETERIKKAFLDGMSTGTFLLMPGGVSQAPMVIAERYPEKLLSIEAKSTVRPGRPKRT